MGPSHILCIRDLGGGGGGEGGGGGHSVDEVGSVCGEALCQIALLQGGAGGGGRGGGGVELW